MVRAILALAIIFVGPGAHAGSVYKCEDAYGTTVFSDRPCGPQPQTAMHNAEQMRESASSGEGPTSTAQMGDHANRIEASKRAVAEARRQARRNLEVQARRATDAASPVTESQSSYTPAGVIRCENNSYSDVSCP